jgi:TPR repeat protein
MLALPIAPTRAQQAIPPASSNRGNYTPVAPQPQHGPPCGHYGTPACPSAASAPAAVSIPAGATADQVWEMGQAAFARGQYAVAAGYMEKAAAMGNVRAQSALGLAYVNGKGEPKDITKAVYWLTLAADKGNRGAQAQLGDLYQEGDGVPQDLAKAFHYHLASAKQGFWKGEQRVGLDYELALGTAHDRPQAIYWLSKATTDGQDGLSQQIVTMLRRSDTPARFRNIDEMGAYFGKLVGDAYAASLPKVGPGCHDHYMGADRGTFHCG